MKRYVIAVPKPRMDDYGFDLLMPPTVTVHEADHTPQATGLVDHRGHAIMAVDESGPIGFLPAREA